MNEQAIVALISAFVSLEPELQAGVLGLFHLIHHSKPATTTVTTTGTVTTTKAVSLNTSTDTTAKAS